MADRFKRLFECTDCYEQYPTHHDAKSCCADGASMVFVCEVCDRDHDTADNARACCIRDQNPASSEVEKNARQTGSVPAEVKTEKPIRCRDFGQVFEAAGKTDKVVKKPIEKPVESEPAVKFIVRPPQADCPRCGIAQKLGRVVSCACMKEVGT